MQKTAKCCGFFCSRKSSQIGVLGVIRIYATVFLFQVS